MPAILLTLRVLLALVLAIAGVAKLADRPGARAAVSGFGVPAALAGPTAALLPLLELAAAVLLVPSLTAPAGAALAFGLMATFSAAIARSIARGEAPECHCFGALHSEPAGPRTLARNLGLAGAAGASLAAGPGTSATGWIGALHGGWLAAVLLGVALAGALSAGLGFGLGLLRRQGELLLRIDTLETVLKASGVAGPSEAPAPTAGLPVGLLAPEFELPDLGGQPVTLSALRAQGDRLLVFTDPGCGPCRALLPQVAAWQRERPGGLRPLVISRGDRAANAGHARQHGLSDVLLQEAREIDESFGVSATPSAVIVTADGRVASAVHAGEAQIHALVATRSDDREPTPTLTLRDLDGEPAPLSAALGLGPTLLVFWDPQCGFCERMLDDLKALDRATDGELLVISTGATEENLAMGLRSPILLDHGFLAGARFGAGGTPSAVMVDPYGRVSSPVAVGADAVLALAGHRRTAVPA